MCGYLVDSWSGSRGGPSGSGHGDNSTGGGGTGGGGAPPPPSVKDYQLVRGSGLEQVPYPLPIPNDTVLLGDDWGSEDG